MSTIDDLKSILRQTLRLGDQVKTFDASTGLFGGIPEFDSMAVVAVIAAIEERFDITIEDDDIRAETFETVGSLCRFIDTKRGQ